MSNQITKSIVIVCSVIFTTISSFAGESLWKFRVGFIFDQENYSSNSDLSLLNAAISTQLSGYLDGFVQIDDSNLIDNRTGNWGYSSEDQLLERPGFVRYQQVTGVDPAYENPLIFQKLNRSGVTFSLVREFKDRPNWSLETSVSLFDGEVTLLDESLVPTAGIYFDHDLGGVTAPSAPYSGSFDSAPGMPRIFFASEQSAYAGGEMIDQVRQLRMKSEVIDWALGLNYRVNLISQLSAQLRGGLGAAFNQVQMEVDEQSVFKGEILREDQTNIKTRWNVDTYLYAGVEVIWEFGEDKQYHLFGGIDHLWFFEDTRQLTSTITRTGADLKYRVGLQIPF